MMRWQGLTSRLLDPPDKLISGHKRSPLSGRSGVEIASVGFFGLL